MARHLDLNQLRTLVLIGRTGSFSAAAAQLFRTQPAVTHQMQQLAAAVGTPLFERTGRLLTMTPEGVKLVHYAKQMLALNDEALRVLDRDQAPSVLRVGAPHDVAETLLPAMLKHLKQQFPRVRVEAAVDRMPRLLQSLEADDLDLCVSTRVAAGCASAVIRTSPCVWICASDFAFDRSQPLPLIVVDGMSFYREVAQAALNESKVRWHVSYVAPDQVGAKAAVRAGLGLTPRCIEMLSTDMRTLGAEDGLPRLPSISFYLLAKAERASSLTRDAFESFRAHWNLLDTPAA